MDSFEAQIQTPDGSIFEEEVEGVQMPGVEGSFEVKKGHASLVSSLDIGTVRIRKIDDSKQFFAITGGFVEVYENKLTLLAEAAESREEIDVERAREAKQRAQERIGDDSMDQARAKRALRRAENRLKVASTL